ncbi:MAG: DsbE family thiol:disulfide interchange protein [Candidatus Accumulibacter sp.]|jgi:cytochrome c biogenesis protein CcmG/thiol:disulfide interchange protein DsbE|nr:DsbE family thiol:disulfide interchange protein [Accumulibacter sp.]
MNRFLWPLIGFAALVVLLAVGLRLNPRELPSPLVGQPAPSFVLPALPKPGVAEQSFSPEDMRGKVWLLNVWATWCVSCRQEHPILVEIAKSGAVTLIGLNYKEVRGDAAFDMDQISAEAEKDLGVQRADAWLKRHGDPYALSALDLDGRVGIDYGVYGVPESYVIDKTGVIRLKHVGPITPELFSGKILPLAAELSK